VFAGAWERSEVESILHALRDARRRGTPSPAFLDIGANLGVFTLTVAALGYNVVAFEGMRRNQEALYASLCATPALLERVTLFPYALGDADATCTMFSSARNVADGHAACTSAERAAMEAAAYVERDVVVSVKLGDFMRGVAVHVLKMDVEGFEPKVLAGAGAPLPGC
jgi:FkbM family methyltransferase